MTPKRTIRFDWAIKSILRDKANFDILEGFLGALLKEDIEILDVLEQNSKGQHMIIELQNDREIDYFARLTFGTSKKIVEDLKFRELFREIKRVISINILYFNSPKIRLWNDFSTQLDQSKWNKITIFHHWNELSFQRFLSL